MLKKLPLGIQSFSKIINGNYAYADKTQYIYKLIKTGGYIFLSRPRRFGKSLLLDTVSAAFSGDRELFRGLWIYGSDYEFKRRPVIRLDMSGVSNKTPDELEESLAINLKQKLAEAEFDIPSYNIPSDLFITLINNLYKKFNCAVVVLIDEYDKPILDHLDDIVAAEANRKVLKSLYGILKSMDSCLELTFITGVTKFAKTSIFSELNNTFDITLTEDYANICGITSDDLDKVFGNHVEQLLNIDKHKSFEAVRNKILEWYDGYSWDGKTRVINPFSLLSFFMQKRFAAFWYASGTPEFLIKILQHKPESYLALSNPIITELMLDMADLSNIDIEPLLFQSGYLTVAEIINTSGADLYKLDMPNFEVRDAFNTNVVAAFTDKNESQVKQSQIKILSALKNGDLRQILFLLRGLFASIPYELYVSKESYYHSIFYAVMNVLGFKIDSEVSVSGGRADATLELIDKIYVIEFKYVKCERDLEDTDKKAIAETALDKAFEQIKSKGYYKRYLYTGKQVYIAAFAFLGGDEIEMRSQLVTSII